ncbi:MAG: metallophosphoesterase [Nitrososphaerota archaeon]
MPTIRFLEDPALLIEGEEKVLVVADLHLGFEREFLSKGINLPSQTNRILGKIEDAILKHRPDRLLILGDVKHEVARLPSYEWKELPIFFEKLLALTEVDVIPGNHDGNLEALLPRGVVIHKAEGILIKDRGLVYLAHGHAWPSQDALRCHFLVTAHQHPIIELRDPSGFKVFERVWIEAGWVRRHIAASFLKAQGIKTKRPLSEFRRRFGFEVKQPKIIIMPAFNQLLGGWPVNSQEEGEYINPIFRSIKTEDSNIYLLDGSYLGKLSTIKSMR